MKSTNILIIFLLCCINLTACVSKDANNKKAPNPPIENGDAINNMQDPPQVVKIKTFEKDKYEEFTYKGGEYGLKFDEVHKYTDLNNKSSMANWICIEYEYENISISEDIEITPNSFIVKDQGNTLLEFASTYEGGESPTRIAKGQEKKVKMIYKAEKPVTKINITFRGIENKEDLGTIELSVNED